MEITLKNVTKIFQAKDKTETVAVSALDITIPDGKLIGLLGPSGCGKSTTLYMIAGLLNPTEGRIFFGDEDVTDLPPEERGIGLVFQNYALYPHMTVRQNIMFPLENIKVPKPEAMERAQEMANLVGIGELMDRKPKQLSGGQQQRVAIARALVKKPRVLLLDEPLSNLDARLRLQTREEIKRIQRETGITTIFVTHDQEEAMSISDEIVLMELGVKQQVGAPQDVYDEPGNLFVAKFLGTPPINIFNGIIKDKKIMIGDAVIGTSKSANADILVGIRPEGFEIVEKSDFELPIYQVETIGRDTTLIVKVPGDEAITYRIIVDAQYRIKPGTVVKFKINPKKVYIFNKTTGELLK
jgi:multiple sugar transport system ATP-binding protein